MTTGTRPGSAVRVLADDLTGALDAAAPLAESLGGVDVHWDVARAAASGGDRIAVDAATRELDRAAAIARTRAAARALWTGHTGLAFKKVDSVWRGHPAAEIGACADDGGFDRVVLAPAFPEEGRVTRDGSQWVRESAGWRRVAADIPAELRSLGLDAAAEAQATDATRVIVCGAMTTEDLDAVVARHAVRAGRTLWCGTRGLARALARRAAATARPGAVARLHGPVLVVVGTDHPVSVAQAAALAQHPRVTCRTVDVVSGQVDVRSGAGDPPVAVLVRFRVPEPMAKAAALRLIARALGDEVDRLPRPGLVVATGGATLRALGEALGATRLAVSGEYEAGIPVAALRDGRWAGTPVLSKSGGFGTRDVFTRVVESLATPPAERSTR